MTDAFNAATRTWTLRSYAAVSSALEDSVFSESGADFVRDAVRGAARDLFPASRLRALRDPLATSARARLETLRVDTPVELMAEFAAPWTRELAAHAIGISTTDASRLSGLARTIFLEAARATHIGTTGDAALALAKELAGHASGAIDVQSFVAMSQTLPHLLVAIWHALFTHPDQLDVWQAQDDRANAIEELLRYAGPSRAVFRTAMRDTSNMRAGDRIVLMLGDANFDEAVFPSPQQLDLNRPNARRQLALGAGLHPCVGTPIIRLAIEVATDALLSRVGRSVIIDEVHWLDGFAIRAPSSLVVRFPWRD